MISCLALLNEISTTGAINFGDSEGNFVGNVSFEGNHANAGGGKRKFEDAFPAIRGA